MPRVPRWAALSASAAPVFLIGGWTLAAALQPKNFDSVRDTISALAGHGATHRWVMTAGLAGLGGCHVVTALGLRPAALPGRLLLAAGGVSTILVAVFPVPAEGSSSVHQAVAGAGFVTLGLWPAVAGRRGRPAPWALRPRPSAAAAVTLCGLLGWFAVELYGDGSRVGLSERAVAGAQALWPLAVVLSARANRAERG
jgi:hypothetical membrane protein